MREQIDNARSALTISSSNRFPAALQVKITSKLDLAIPGCGLKRRPLNDNVRALPRGPPDEEGQEQNKARPQIQLDGFS